MAQKIESELETRLRATIGRESFTAHCALLNADMLDF